MSCWRRLTPRISSPLRLFTMSNARRPALPAGPLAEHVTHHHASGDGETEVHGEFTRELAGHEAKIAAFNVLPSMRLGSTRLMIELGIAKPMPMKPSDCSGEKMAVLMPMSSPSVLTSAPPELPWLMAASVWMKSS